MNWKALAFAFCVAIVLGGWYAYPKRMALPAGPSGECVGYYKGFGLTQAPSVFGTMLYRNDCRDHPDCGFTEVLYAGDGYNAFRSYYPGGTIAAEGKCKVNLIGVPAHPSVNIYDVFSARYYSPNGVVASAVVAGVGVQTLHYPDGNVRWRAQIAGCRVVFYEWYNEDGTLISRVP